ncbi:TonB family protein [Endozoicomonadaceae bacterium StTr2]
MLCFSAAAHYVVFQWQSDTEIQLAKSSGALSAPVSVSFVSVTPSASVRSEPEPSKPEPVKPESAPPELIEKPEVVKEKAVIKPKEKPRQEPVKKPQPKPRPKITKPDSKVEKEQKTKAEPKPKSEPDKKPEVNQPNQQASVRKKVESDIVGLSEEIPVMSNPAYRRQPPQQYPRLAQRRNIEGVVLLEVLVDAGGYPEEIEIIKSSGFDILDRAATRAVRKWEFVPMERDGIAIQSKVHVPVVYRLQ